MNLHVPKTANVLGFFLHQKLLYIKQIIALVIVVLFSTLTAQTNFTVLDLWTEQPVDSAQLEFTNLILITDHQGKAELHQQIIDTTTIEISKENYYDLTIQLYPYNKHYSIYLQPIEQANSISVTSEKPKISNIEIPGANTIIKLDNKQIDGKKLARILNNSTGIFIKEYGSNSSLKTVSFRGLAAEQTLIAYDGISLNNAQLGLQDLSATGISNAGQIEVYRGGNSILFGSGAAAGAINIIPVPLYSKIFYNYSMGIGSWDRKSSSLEIHLPVAEFKQKLFLNYYSSEGNFPFYLKNKKYFRKNNNSEMYGINYAFDSNKLNLAGEIIYNNSERGVPKQVLTNFRQDDKARQSDKNYFARLKWYPVEQMNLQVYWINQNMSYTDPLYIINNNPIDNTHDDRVTGAQINKTISISSKITGHTKIEFEQTKISSNQAGKHHRFRWALNSILEWQTFQTENTQANMTGSFRWDNFSDIGSVFLPKFGSIIKYKNLSWYFSFGRNFRAPTFNELYWQPGGNKDLNPEKSISFESGLIYNFKLLGNWKTSLDIYRNDFDDLIRWLPTNMIHIWQPINISSVTCQGIEIGLDFQNTSKDFGAIINYSYGEIEKQNPDDTEDKTVGNQLPFVPRELINVVVNYKWNSINASATWNRTSFRYTTFVNNNNEILPSFTVVGFSMKYNIEYKNHAIDFELELENVLDKNYQVMLGYPMPGRSINFNVNIFNLIRS